MNVRREVEIDATPEEVWDALVSEEGRRSWLDEPDREVQVEAVEAPHRLVWWWGDDDEPMTRVEVLVVASPPGARVVVVESAPSFPLTALAASFAAMAV
jgi:uncharacterized protein YndB with AHSA1/START domain